MKKCRILVPFACRSDEGITKPIIKRLELDWQNFTLETIELIPSVFSTNYQVLDGAWNHDIKEKPDLIYIAGDRIEMVAAACAAFHNNIPIAHYGSGIVNQLISTYDDISRHCIGLWATIAFCEDRKSYMVINRLWNTIGKCTFKDKMNLHIVGNVYLDDLIIDESLVPEEPYDLALFNPTTLTEDSDEIMFPERKCIRIGSNPDGQGYMGVIKEGFITYDNLPRPQFLGLLKNCTRFITNSSCAYYEAPYLGLKKEQIIIRGMRNRMRSTPQNLQAGASDKIIKIIKEWWELEQE